MGLKFTTTSDQVANTLFLALGVGGGTISIWAKPNGWSSGDSTTHVFWDFDTNSTLSFQKFSDNNVYVGVNQVSDQRIVIADTGLFTSGAWANWIFTWSVAQGQTIYKNGVSKGTHSLGAEPTTSSGGVSVGNYTGSGTRNVSATLTDFAVWSSVLTASEINAIALGYARPDMVRKQALTLYWPLGFGNVMVDRGYSATQGKIVSGSVTSYDTDPPLMPPRFQNFAALPFTNIPIMATESNIAQVVSNFSQSFFMYP